MSHNGWYFVYFGGFFSSQFDSVLKFLEFEWPTQVLFYIYRILDHF